MQGFKWSSKVWLWFHEFVCILERCDGCDHPRLDAPILAMFGNVPGVLSNISVPLAPLTNILDVFNLLHWDCTEPEILIRGNIREDEESIIDNKKSSQLLDMQSFKGIRISEPLIRSILVSRLPYANQSIKTRLNSWRPQTATNLIARVHAAQVEI